MHHKHKARQVIEEDQKIQSYSRVQSYPVLQYVKLVCYFLLNFYFSPNDSPSKTMKFFFDFIEKALFILEIFKF